jgi:transposase
LFLFFGKRRDALKVLFYDGTGLCIFYKRLDRGTFKVPEAHHPGVASVELDEAALDALLDGLTLEKPTKDVARRRVH